MTPSTLLANFDRPISRLTVQFDNIAQLLPDNELVVESLAWPGGHHPPDCPRCQAANQVSTRVFKLSYFTTAIVKALIEEVPLLDPIFRDRMIDNG